MSKSIWQDLYFGNFSSAWERKPIRTPENLKLNRKIEDEKRYFIQKMSLDDCSRFQSLENLYLKATEDEQVDAFAYGFKLATMLMSAVFIDNDVSLYEHNQE